MGEAALRRITVDEFLSWDGDPNRRYELIAGEIVAMERPSNAHGLIVANAAFALSLPLKPPYLAAVGVGIVLPWRDDVYYQADLAITSSSVTRQDWALTNPVVIIEVLSRTTMARDRDVKLVDYRHIPSVEAIILVESDCKSVDFWRRDRSSWTVVGLQAADHIDLHAIGFDIPVEALYEGLDLSQGADAPKVADA